jgi:hypothetical protein
MNLCGVFVFFTVLTLSAVLCIGAETVTKTDNALLPYISLPISVYILDDRNGELSSTRTNEKLIEVFDKANQIWSQAGIKFEIKYIGRIVLPSNILKELTNGNYNPFLTGVDREFQISNPSLLNAFYTSSIGQVNGIAARSNMFFVTDFPSVRHERVTAHEIGHLLGLGHAHRDTARLMYSGTNGTILTKEEIKTARNNAKHKLNTTYHQD